jgi:hypothetical protein
MSSYNGTAEFDWDIERYTDPSGNLITGEEVPEGVEYPYHMIKLTVKGRAYFVSGKTWGPPDSCYPDEGEIEILSIVDDKGNSWDGKLTKKEEEEVNEQIDMKVRESCESDYDDRDPEDYYGDDF